jgi:hypothetical protein
MIMKSQKINCIIVHGCPSSPETNIMSKARYFRHWIFWTKRELNKRGIKTDTPVMPEPWHPDYKKFRKEIENYHITENTILIGHSCGCAFLVRWLGETKRKIKKLILVAPWKINAKHDKWRKLFYEYPIDRTIQERVKEIVMFTADNENENGKKSLSIFQEALGGKIIELKGRGHFVFEDMGTEEFPELLKEAVLGIRIRRS